MKKNIKNYILGALAGFSLGIVVSTPLVKYSVTPIEIHMLDYDGDGKIDHCRIKTKRGYTDHPIDIEYREINIPKRNENIEKIIKNYL